MESIGRYQIIRELGRGAMGVVYLAEDPAIGRPVAIKTINLDNLSEPGQEQMLRDRLMREARSAGILSHPGIVTVYDIQHEGHFACIVMEFVEGVTLHDRMVRGDLQADEASSIMEQSAAAIDYAHSKGVLHRDIKPANLMFTTTGQVKVADFGVARLSSQKTATTGMVMGTPAYMAPEQIANKALGPATDQFSLAVMAFELLTGQKPFDGDSISGLLYCIVFQDPVSVRSLNPTLPEAVESVFRKALSKEPADRYPNCSAFARALRNACETRKTWKPVRTVRGTQLSIPADLAGFGGTMGAWGSESEAPVPPSARAAAPSPPSVIPSPVAPPPEPKADLPKTVVPNPVAPKPVEPTPVAEAVVPRVKAPQPPVIEEPAAYEKPKSETKKIALAFAASFVAIVIVYMAWPSSKPTETAPNLVAQAPAPLNSGSGKEAGKKSAALAPAAQAPVDTKPPDGGAKAVPAAAKTFPVEMNTQPPKATITVKEQTCVTPCELQLPAGEYYVKAELEGYKMAFQRIQVPAVMDLNVQLQKPMGTIEVRGNAGATIYLNGKAWKDKAPARFSVEQGSYVLVIETADGSKGPEYKVEITEGKIVTLQ